MNNFSYSMRKRCNCEIYTSTEAGDKIEHKKLLQLLRIAASPNRLRLLFLIDRFPHCVRDIVLDTGLSQTLISHHLSDLLQEGLVEKNRLESYVDYGITEKGREFVEDLKNIHIQVF